MDTFSFGKWVPSDEGWSLTTWFVLTLSGFLNSYSQSFPLIKGDKIKIPLPIVKSIIEATHAEGYRLLDLSLAINPLENIRTCGWARGVLESPRAFRGIAGTVIQTHEAASMLTPWSYSAERHCFSYENSSMFWLGYSRTFTSWKCLVPFNNRADQVPWLHFNLSYVIPEEVPPPRSSITPLDYTRLPSLLYARHGPCQHSLARYFPQSFPSHVPVIATLGINCSGEDYLLYSAPLQNTCSSLVARFLALPGLRVLTMYGRVAEIFFSVPVLLDGPSDCIILATGTMQPMADPWTLLL